LPPPYGWGSDTLGVGDGVAVGVGDEVGGPGSDRTGDGASEAGRVGVDGEDGGTWWDDGSPGCVAPVEPGGTVKALAGACPAAPAVPGALVPGDWPGAADPGV
jgi:hypothetical protein